MLRVGLTGNIGSGKTIVAQVFGKLGVPVFQADLEARKLFDNHEIKEKIRKIFGNTVFSTSDDILRPVIAEIVFNDQPLLEKLNQVVHPAVRLHYKQWCIRFEQVPYTLYEAAILFESGHNKEMDRIICVTAPEELRIRRVMERDHLTRQEVEKRIARQWPEEKKSAMADFIIRNDGSEQVIKQVMKIHKYLILNA